MKQKKVERWIGFFYLKNEDRIVIQGNGAYPGLYKTKEEAIQRTSSPNYECEVIPIMVYPDRVKNQ